jgi:hypothetical protein
MIKPGYKTSEFWFTLVTFLFSGLYLLGVIKDIQQKDELIGNISHAVESCILIGGQIIVLYKYIKGRTELKELWWNTASETERQIANKNNSKKKKRDINAKRPHTTRNTKTGKHSEETDK